MNAVFVVHCWIRMKPLNCIHQLTYNYAQINQPTIILGLGVPKNAFVPSPHLSRLSAITLFDFNDFFYYFPVCGRESIVFWSNFRNAELDGYFEFS